jgi:hypothetical protein
MIREMAAERFAPGEAKARAAAVKVEAALLKASQLYSNEHWKLVPTVKDDPREGALKRLKESANG